MTAVRERTVSVVVPNKNYGQLLQRALQSVVQQTFTDWQLIIVDDGSTDNSREIITQFVSDHDECDITVLWSKAGGLSRARNRGLAVSRSPYALCLDSDDALEPDALTHLINALETDPSAAVARYLVTFEQPDGRTEISETGYYEILTLPAEMKPFSLDALKTLNIVPYCAMFRREWWEQVRGFDESMPGYEDWDFWLRIAKLGGRFISVPEPLVRYRVSDSGLYAESLNIDKMLRARITLNHPELYGWTEVEAANAELTGLISQREEQNAEH